MDCEGECAGDEECAAVLFEAGEFGGEVGSSIGSDAVVGGRGVVVGVGLVICFRVSVSVSIRVNIGIHSHSCGRRCGGVWIGVSGASIFALDNR